MKLSRVLLTAFYAAIVVCMFIPAILKRILHFDIGHETAWMSFGTGLLMFVTAAITLLEKTKPGQSGKGLMALSFAGTGVFCIFLGVGDFFTVLNAIGCGGWIVVLALVLFFAVIGHVGSRRFYRKEFFPREAESAERMDGQQQDRGGEEPNPNQSDQGEK